MCIILKNKKYIWIIWKYKKILVCISWSMNVTMKSWLMRMSMCNQKSCFVRVLDIFHRLTTYINWKCARVCLSCALMAHNKKQSASSIVLAHLSVITTGSMRNVHICVRWCWYKKWKMRLSFFHHFSSLRATRDIHSKHVCKLHFRNFSVDQHDDSSVWIGLIEIKILQTKTYINLCVHNVQSWKDIFDMAIYLHLCLAPSFPFLT